MDTLLYKYFGIVHLETLNQEEEPVFSAKKRQEIIFILCAMELVIEVYELRFSPEPSLPYQKRIGE
jgi:hypothetical protein